MIHWDDRGPAVVERRPRDPYHDCRRTHRRRQRRPRRRPVDRVRHVPPRRRVARRADPAGPRCRQASPPHRLRLGSLGDQHHRRLARQHQAAERLLRHRRQVLRRRLSRGTAPLRRAGPGRHAGRRAERLPRADPAGRRQETVAQGGRDRQRTDARGFGLREHARLADQLRRDVGLRCRAAHRDRQWPDAVDRAGVEAGAERGVRRQDRGGPGSATTTSSTPPSSASARSG